ncbi:MAG: sulfotransferase [Alphaproteobacteria bacterium]
MRELFITGIARSGTSLIGRMIDAHPQAAVAIDAFLPLVRAMRNSIVLAREPDFDPARPMEDGYFAPGQRARLAAIWRGSLDCPLAGTDLATLRGAIGRRAADESGDLVEAASQVDGATLSGLFGDALRRIAAVRRVPADGVVGMKDLWAIDLLPALARTRPAARFVVVLRDPRDVVSSVLGYLSVDPDQVAHVLSVARHWRKLVATLHAWSGDALFDGRLLVIRYEDVVADPAAFARDAARLLDLSDDGSMLRADRFRDYNSGGTWRGNSTFDAALAGISARPRERWRETLAPAVVALVELVCGPEMTDAGYTPSLPEDAHGARDDVLAFLVRDGRRACSWRSDSGDTLHDYGCELTRRALLALPEDEADAAMLEGAFLFADYARTLRRHLARAA